MPSPFTPLQELIDRRESGRSSEIVRFSDRMPIPVPVTTMPGNEGGFDFQAGNGGQAARAGFWNRSPFWIFSLVSWSVVSAGGLVLGGRRLRAPKP
jgi:hypothetical protein